MVPVMFQLEMPLQATQSCLAWYRCHMEGHTGGELFISDPWCFVIGTMRCVKLPPMFSEAGQVHFMIILAFRI